MSVGTPIDQVCYARDIQEISKRCRFDEGDVRHPFASHVSSGHVWYNFTMTTLAPASEADILARIIDPNENILPADLARSILTFEFQPDDRDHMSALAEKARQGTLTEEEQIQIDCYERVGNFLSLLKSKARRSLKQLTDHSGEA